MKESEKESDKCLARRNKIYLDTLKQSGGR